MEAKIDRNSNGLTHKGLFGFIFFITQFPSLITYYSIFHIRLASSPNFHHSIFFTLFMGPYLSAGVAFFFFFQYPNSLKLILKINK